MPTELPVADEPRPDRCETCRYWTASGERIDTNLPEDGRMGHCHRYPPRFRDESDDDGGWDKFPHLHKDDWCGEWQAKPRTTDDMPTEELIKIRDDALRAIGPDSETAQIMDRIIRERKARS